MKKTKLPKLHGIELPKTAAEFYAMPKKKRLPKMIPMPRVRVHKTETGYEVLMNERCVTRHSHRYLAAGMAIHLRKALQAKVNDHN